jgi:meso-butanediol dehydrogenase / (S,S)-butanediol dehydrogenase / diacetyl reductase
VRLNVVAPAFTRTELTAGMAQDEASLAPFVNRIALGRPAEPSDIARAVMFLASAQASYITGAVLRFDGGTSASTSQTARLRAHTPDTAHLRGLGTGLREQRSSLSTRD